MGVWISLDIFLDIFVWISSGYLGYLGETVRYIHFGKQVLEERNTFNELQRQYVYGNGIDEVLQLRTAANKDYYYHDNSLGSIAAITNSEGQVVERYRDNPNNSSTQNSDSGSKK